MIAVDALHSFSLAAIEFYKIIQFEGKNISVVSIPMLLQYEELISNLIFYIKTGNFCSNDALL